MPRLGRGNSYSARAWLVAAFVVLAMVLGGGGSPNPVTELVLELAFAGAAVLWLLLPRGRAQTAVPADRLAIALAALILLVPIAQLVPLPQSLWAALPGRENEVAALSLIGDQHGWRPISMSPSRTLAGLLAMMPALFCLVAVGRLEPAGRRLVLAAVSAMALISAVIGAAQLIMPTARVNLYEQYSHGWITGFQANRNAEADVLLIGFLALAVVAAPYLAGKRQKFRLGLDRRMFALLIGGLGLLLLLATIMTGSRAGMVLAAGAFIGGLAIVATEAKVSPGGAGVSAFWVVPLVLIAAIAIYFVSFSENTALGRAAERFSDLENSRSEIWKDTRFAIDQTWPVGVGLGGFGPSLVAAERLEVLDQAVPNRAHNDYLEIGLEAGVAGYAVLIAGVVLCLTMAWLKWRDDPDMRAQTLFGLSVLLLIALHSVVDYPLRSMAMACLAGVAVGMLSRIGAPTPSRAFWMGRERLDPA